MRGRLPATTILTMIVLGVLCLISEHSRGQQRPNQKTAPEAGGVATVQGSPATAVVAACGFARFPCLSKELSP